MSGRGGITYVLGARCGVAAGGSATIVCDFCGLRHIDSDMVLGGITDVALEIDEAIPWPALEGTMGDRTFYMTVLTLQTVARYFEPTPEDLPAELRAQRALSERRIPDIQQYMMEKDRDWVFGSLTLSYDGEVEYDAERRILFLDPATTFVVVDGQHRLAAIQRAVKEDPTLRKQSIGVMLLAYESLQRNQQVFSDLNRTVQKTSRSLDILYDHDDPMTGLVKYVAENVPLFKGRIERNKTSLALRSAAFITLSALYDACTQLLGGKRALEQLRADEDLVGDAQDFCVAYWSHLSGLIEPWRQVRDGEIRPAEARIESIVAHAVAFYALGKAGAVLMGVDGPNTWDVGAVAAHEELDSLREVDWRKSNDDWQGVVMQGSSIVTRFQTRQALANKICNLVEPARFPDVPRVL